MRYPNIIVSCTTYPPRFRSAATALRSILNQTIKPSRVILYLGRDDCVDESHIPDELLSLSRQGLDIQWVDSSLKSHDKYYWAMRTLPDDIIITIDDDVIYPLNTVEKLYYSHLVFPDSIIANNTHQIVGENGIVAPYRKWIPSQTTHLNEKRFDIMPVGVGGVLYPPHSLDTTLLLNRDAIQELAPNTDDLWLFMNEQLSGVPVVAINPNPYLNYVPNSQNQALYHANLENGGNDIALNNLFDAFPVFQDTLIGHVVYWLGENDTPNDPRPNSNSRITRILNRIASAFQSIKSNDGK